MSLLTITYAIVSILLSRVFFLLDTRFQMCFCMGPFSRCWVYCDSWNWPRSGQRVSQVFSTENTTMHSLCSTPLLEKCTLYAIGFSGSTWFSEGALPKLQGSDTVFVEVGREKRAFYMVLGKTTWFAREWLDFRVSKLFGKRRHPQDDTAPVSVVGLIRNFDPVLYAEIYYIGVCDFSSKLHGPRYNWCHQWYPFLKLVGDNMKGSPQEIPQQAIWPRQSSVPANLVSRVVAS